MKDKKIKKRASTITTLFVDIGGVLLTNGWDTHSRKLAAKAFKLDFDVLEAQHHLTFDTFESGKMTLDEYLHRIVFYQKRAFTRAQFREFIFAQSKSYPQMIELLCQLKAQYSLKIAAVNNEAREINEYRIKKFKMRNFIDFFISSCYLHLRKPDLDILRMAIDIAQTPLNQLIYIDDKSMFISVAEELGIKGIHHTDYQSTRDKLTKFGLCVSGAGI